MNSENRLAAISGMDDIQKGNILAYIAGYAPDVFDTAVSYQAGMHERVAQMLREIRESVS